MRFSQTRIIFKNKLYQLILIMLKKQERFLRTLKNKGTPCKKMILGYLQDIYRYFRIWRGEWPTGGWTEGPRAGWMVFKIMLENSNSLKKEVEIIYLSVISCRPMLATQGKLQQQQQTQDYDWNKYKNNKVISKVRKVPLT